MIDTLVKLLEKSIEFLKLRKDAEKRAFDLLVNPIFNGLKAVHEDYLQLFQSCHRNLKEGTELTVIATQLMSERLEQEALRRSLLAFVDTYRENSRLKSYSDFFRAVSAYLRDTRLSGRDTRSNMLLCEMEHWAREERKRKFQPDDHDGEKPREMLASITDKFLTDIREAWKNVAREYAAITAKTITT